MNLKETLNYDFSRSELFAESIAHVLHQDIAYLWALSMEPAYLPAGWKWRVQAWRTLLATYLLGMATTKKRRVDPPLRQLLAPYGMEEIDEVSVGTRVVGVLSPVCIVRPLPDTTEEQIGLLGDNVNMHTEPLVQLLGFLRDDVAALCEREGGRRVQNDLLTALDRYRTGISVSVAGAHTHGIPIHRPLSHRLIRDIDFGSRHPVPTDPITVYQWSSVYQRVYVPQCQRNNCGELLMQSRSDPPVEVLNGFIELSCRKCGERSAIPIANFFLWRRTKDSKQEVVIWTDRESVQSSSGQLDLPPDPVLDGDTLHFVWNLTDALRREQAYLSLRFPNCTMTQASLKSVFYERMLLPGTTVEQYEGLPVKAVWRDALAGYKSAVRQHLSLTFPALQIQGIPVPVRRSYGPASIEQAPELFPFVYPKRMHPGWRLYRAILSGQGTPTAWKLSADGVDEGAPGAVTLEHWPAFVSIEDSDARVGVTWDLRTIAAPDVTLQDGLTVNLGLDFGTANTVLFAKASSDTGKVQSVTDAVHRREILSLAHPLHETGAVVESGYLPTPADGNDDDALLPSALWWSGPGSAWIRWSPKTPAGNYQMRSGFKWNSPGHSRRAERRAFLFELFHLALPAVLAKLRIRGAAPALRIAFSYPLAMTADERGEYLELQEELVDWMKTRCGFPEVTSVLINESLASLRAAGAFNPGDQFLIADLGGHTLDLSLFTKTAEASKQTDRAHLHQVGSLRLGGEALIRAYARATSSRVRPDAEAEDRDYWAVRDRLMTVAGRAGLANNGDFVSRMERLHTIALEFVRTMAEAWLLCRKDTAVPQGKPLHVLLVGNGWRLREMTAKGNPPDELFRRHFERSIGAFGPAGIQFMADPLDGVSHSKHWVAAGALRAAIEQDSDPRNASPSEVRLPAGRDYAIGERVTKWHENEGPGGKELGFSTSGAMAQEIEFSLTESGPSHSPAWSHYLDEAIPPDRRYPSIPGLRHLVKQQIAGDYVAQGPLQLILENHWVEELDR